MHAKSVFVVLALLVPGRASASDMLGKLVKAMSEAQHSPHIATIAQKSLDVIGRKHLASPTGEYSPQTFHSALPLMLDVIEGKKVSPRKGDGKRSVMEITTTGTIGNQSISIVRRVVDGDLAKTSLTVGRLTIGLRTPNWTRPGTDPLTISAKRGKQGKGERYYQRHPLHPGQIYRSQRPGRP